MSVLIIDSDQSTRLQCADMFRRVDSRRRIDIAGSIESGKALALKRQYRVVVCDPVLKDGCGISLCTEFKREMESSIFAAYGDPIVAWQQQRRVFPFDAVLDKPPKRFSVVSLLLQAEHKSKMFEKNQPELRAPRNGTYAPDPEDKSRYNCVTVCLSGENLRFGMSVPRGATVAGLIARMEKSGCAAVELRRSEAPVNFTADSFLMDGDVLVLVSE